MATVKELKEMLIEERVARICNDVPDGYCPNAYYPFFEYEAGCESEDKKDSCFQCKKRFRTAVEKAVRKKIEKQKKELQAELKKESLFSWLPQLIQTQYFSRKKLKIICGSNTKKRSIRLNLKMTRAF